MNILGRIKEILDAQMVEAEPEKDLVPSAVMLILGRKDGDYGIWFIKRAECGRDVFSGHVGFPGGKKKDNDAGLLDTALREVREELGFDVHEKGKVLGQMDFVRPYTPSVRRYMVKPFIAALQSETEFVPNHELSEFFWVSVFHLLDGKKRDVRERKRDGRIIDDYVFTYRNHIIWGVTGRILDEFFKKTSECFAE